MKSRLLLIVCCLSLVLVGSGCVSKNKARLREREAFIAGQQQAMSQLRQVSSVVQIVGEVENPTLPWSEGLTLAQAIVAADYRGFRDPKEIVIERQGQTIAINPKALLRGEDEPLQAGDRIILR